MDDDFLDGGEGCVLTIAHACFNYFKIGRDAYSFYMVGSFMIIIFNIFGCFAGLELRISLRMMSSNGVRRKRKELTFKKRATYTVRIYIEFLQL